MLQNRVQKQWRSLQKLRHVNVNVFGRLLRHRTHRVSVITVVVVTVITETAEIEQRTVVSVIRI